MPAIATGVRLPWDDVVEDPVAALADARSRLGDTFVVDSGDDRYLFLFSPLGVTALYGLPEETASKGVADWRMLRRKLPDEVFAGRRVLPHQLFGREDVAAYLRNVELAVEAAADELGSEGEVDLFSLSRRLGHRVGLASWGGPGAAEGERFEALIRSFDQLDGSESFVHPGAMAHVAATDKAEERAALAEVTAQLGLGLEQRRASERDGERRPRAHALRSGRGRLGRRRSGGGSHGHLPRHHPHPRRIHVQPVCRAGLASRRSHGAPRRSRTGAPRRDRPGRDLCPRVDPNGAALHHGSLHPRFVFHRPRRRPARGPRGHDGRHPAAAHQSQRGPGLDRWDPARWNRRRLRTPNGLAAAELVTVFGHGGHSCPARPFSLAAMTLTSRRLLSQFRWEPSWSEHPDPVPAQIGGVARAAAPCRARYRRR